MDYQLIRSRRKTISAEVRESGIVVRAPLRTSRREADAFLEKHRAWLDRQLEKSARSRAAAEALGKLSEEELRELSEQAREILPERVRHYAALLGVDYGRITIRCQRTRWGSCSTKRNLNFNCLLMLTPPKIIDSVVVHEVCHLRQMNHSRAFYALVHRLCPDYDERDKWLKEHGRLLLARLPDAPGDPAV